MPALTESIVEDAALAWLGSFGWMVKHGPEIAPGELAAERSDYGQVMLAQRLQDALSHNARNDALRRDAERAAVASYLRAHADHAPSGLWDAYGLNLMAARIATGEGVDGAALVECLRKGGAQ